MVTDGKWLNDSLSLSYPQKIIWSDVHPNITAELFADLQVQGHLPKLRVKVPKIPSHLPQYENYTHVFNEAFPEYKTKPYFPFLETMFFVCKTNENTDLELTQCHSYSSFWVLEILDLNFTLK